MYPVESKYHCDLILIIFPSETCEQAFKRCEQILR